jgi:hypothetical protein
VGKELVMADRDWPALAAVCGAVLLYLLFLAVLAALFQWIAEVMP